jgi:hypothetical protein
MNEAIMVEAGFKDEVDLIKSGKCPFCGNSINMEDFKDELSKKEFKISGLCQVCQDDVFKEEE